MKRFLTCLAIALFLVPTRASALPTTSEEKAQAIGQPTAVIVQPSAVTLAGPRSMQQLIVTGKYADGTVRDLTPVVEFKTGADLVHVDAGLFLTPVKNGSTSIAIKAGSKTIDVPVVVRDIDKADRVNFRNDLIAALNVGGCNQGACHGTPSGKNGFKLSLRGYDPTSDYIQLTRDVMGRRTDRQGPDRSLLYLKALGRVAHEGGSRFAPESIPGKAMYGWLAEGLTDDPKDNPTVQKVEVIPGSRVLNEPASFQQLAVMATFSNGETRDVTRLTVFTSSDDAIAFVNPAGLVEFNQAGEVAILCRYLEELVPIRLTYLEKTPDGFKWNNPKENNFVDKLIFSKLKMLNILPSQTCTDQEFLRRAYMDLCATLPTPEDTRSFLSSKDPNKRAKLIDSLLDRPEYADFWTLKWADVFRNSRKTAQLKGTFAFQKWLRHRIATNMPFDELVRDVITSSGSTFSNPAANYYRVSREPTALAETTAQLFFGIRMQCAKCHNHPFERWTQDDYYSMAAFFARVKQKVDPIEPGDPRKKSGAEYIYLSRSGEVTQPRTGKTMAPKFLGGAVADLSGKERRQALAEWMTSDNNPFLPKSVVNRIWFHLLGKGIVDPVDDFRDSNPSANDELLDALAREFVKNNFDVKHVIRTIMNSNTYQLSAQTNDYNADDSKYFSHAVTKLHTAEQLFDALCYVTGVPENFSGMPPGTRAVQLPDGEVNHPFLKTFGQPARELACECERESDSNLAQALQLINGPAVNDRLRNGNNRIGKLMAAKMTNEKMLEELFLITLSRTPNAEEASALLNHVSSSVDKRKAWEDVHWALINSKEFLFRH